MNTFVITRSIIDGCIGFIAGYKADKALRFYEVRTLDFPNNLLLGNEKEQRVMSLINKGYSCQLTAETLGLSKGTITRHIANYKERVAFYYEYTAFLMFIKPVLKKPLYKLFYDLDTGFASACVKKGVGTIGDLIDIYTHYPLAQVKEKTLFLKLDRKKLIFNRIAEECYKLLDTSDNQPK